MSTQILYGITQEIATLSEKGVSGKDIEKVCRLMLIDFIIDYDPSSKSSL